MFSHTYKKSLLGKGIHHTYKKVFIGKGNTPYILKSLYWEREYTIQPYIQKSLYWNTPYILKSLLGKGIHHTYKKVFIGKGNTPYILKSIHGGGGGGGIRQWRTYYIVFNYWFSRLQITADNCRNNEQQPPPGNRFSICTSTCSLCSKS